MQRRKESTFRTLDSLEEARSFLASELRMFEAAVDKTNQMLRISPSEQIINQLRYYKDCASCVKKMLYDLSLERNRLQESDNVNIK